MCALILIFYADYSIASSDVVSKLKTAGTISNGALRHAIGLCVPGASTYEICVAGDEFMRKELALVFSGKKNKTMMKGLAFPTTVSPNHVVAHLAPMVESEKSNFVLADGDVVKIMLGAQIDGHPAIVAETVVVGALSSKPIDGPVADLMHATWVASEAAIRTFVPGKSNWNVTDIVDEVAAAYLVAAVEDMLSHLQLRNVMYGDQEIILNPLPKNRKQMGTFKFAENEVYALDVLMTTAPNGKVRSTDLRTSLYKLTGNQYALRMKMSHKTLADLREHLSGLFPVNIREFEDNSRARGGLVEACNHNVVLPYEVVGAKEGEYVAQVLTTFGITKNGIVKYTAPEFCPDAFSTTKKVDEKIDQLLATPLKKEKEGK